MVGFHQAVFFFNRRARSYRPHKDVIGGAPVLAQFAIRNNQRGLGG